MLRNGLHIHKHVKERIHFFKKNLDAEFKAFSITHCFARKHSQQNPRGYQASPS